MAENNASQSETFSAREYQLEMLEAAKEKNIIVCLGTGTGKTFISIKFIKHLARVDDIIRPFSQGAKRTIFLVNTVPLVSQQAEAIRLHTALNVTSFCGEAIEMDVNKWSEKAWLEEFEKNHVLVMTAKIYLDLLDNAKLKLSQANLLVFDECHRAKKKHDFKRIMDWFACVPSQDHPRILGLTASVLDGNVKPNMISEKIKDLEHTLRSVCKTASDPMVVEKYGAKPTESLREYTKHLNDVAKLEHEFHSLLDPLYAFLKDINFKVEIRDTRGSEEIFAKALAIAKSGVSECLAALKDIGIWGAYEVSRMLADELEKRNTRAADFTETASLLLQATLTSLRELRWIYDRTFGMANLNGRENIQQEYLKPKVKKLLELFTKSEGDPSMCSIVFVQRRFAACVLSKLINTTLHLTSDFVTGHGSEQWGTTDAGTHFKKQKEKLKKFKNGSFNVLVGTSVIEEGVDIPKCNLVVMFDFPQNYRAYVQSRGRGRAEGAKYIMLVESSDLGERKQNLEMYQHIDDHLRKFCQSDRDMPTEEEANEAINVYPLPDYYTSVGAKLDMANSIERLYRYCFKLPCDRFSCLKPKFTLLKVDAKYQCSLQMPGNCSHVIKIKGEVMANSAMAKQAVAMKACIMLHKVRQGGLDDNLSPVESDSESESEDESDSPAQPKIGTRKRKRLHIVGTSKQLYGRLTTDGSENVYVYAINMKLDEVSSTVKKSLWDRKRVLFGIITNGELPELPPFSLYNDIGKLTVVLERCQSEVVLTPNQRDLIDWFHEFTFIETLQFKFESLTRNGCRVVLLNYDGSSVTSNEPTVHGSVASGGINFNEMGLLKKNALESDGRFSCNTDLFDSVVIKAYLPQRNPPQRNPDPRHYMVTSTHGNPSSEFPDPDKAKTFKEYYEKNYDIKIMDLSQPLVEVIPHSHDIDCRSGKGKSDKPNERLIPELLKFRTSSQSLTLRALLLPTILYRINSLVSMSQLQDSVVREITNASCVDNTPEPPAKRLKLLTLSSVKEGNSNDNTMVEPFQSLSKYFYPFDNSKSVPLLQLLEAMTCASSRDNFDLERLEMLGDSFLKIAVSVHVYWHKNHKDEGKLTKYRTRQISNKKLFELADKRQLSKYIKHSVFSKQTWFPPGFTSPQSKVENGNSSCCGDHDFDVSTHDVIHDDVVHDNAMQDDAAGDAMCEEGSEDVMYNGATGDAIHDDAMHEDASDNVVNKDVTNNVMNNDFDSYYVMKQEIPDKSVADSMEALIGAHLVHCGYMGALRFMTWLGLDVFHSDDTENRKLTNNYRRRKSSQYKSKYANYPLPTLDIPADESNVRYEQLLDEHTKEMASFEEKIGYTFKNKVLLLEAFTHPTYYDNTITGSYQRLEFLGDAILDFLVTQHIYNKCETNLKPGDLTDLRSALVNNNIFAVIAVENDYHKYLKEYSPHLFTTMGHFVTVAREHQQNLGDKVIPDPYVIAVESDSSDVQCIEAPKPLGDVFESVAGAIFLDSGLDIFEVWRVCYPMLQKYIDEYSKKVPKNLVRRVEESDSKAEFSSANIMKNGRVSCVLTFNGQKYDGVGRNKRNAKLSAAYKALHNI